MKKKREEIIIPKYTPVNFKLTGIKEIYMFQGIVQNWMVLECENKETEDTLRKIIYFKETKEQATHIISQTKIISYKNK